MVELIKKKLNFAFYFICVVFLLFAVAYFQNLVFWNSMFKLSVDGNWVIDNMDTYEIINY